MNKSVVTLLLLCISLASVAQDLKTYQGTYLNGKASYTYFDNQQADRIYQGPFSFVEKTYSYKGSFQDNFRQGDWKISAYKKTVSNPSKHKVRLTSTLTGTYEKGALDGAWKFSQYVQFYHPKTKRLTSNIDKMEAQATFKNGFFTGEISLKHTENRIVYTYTGQFNDLGQAEGIWLIESNKKLEKTIYSKGMIVSRLVKDLTTGEKLVDYDSSTFIASFWKAFDKKKGLSETGNRLYFLDTVASTNLAVQAWTNTVFNYDYYDSLVHPFSQFSKGQVKPKAYELRIIGCDTGTDCYTQYQTRKAEELERRRILEEQEQRIYQEKAQAEAEAKRIAAEKEAERLRQVKLSNLLSEAGTRYDEQNYIEARKLYKEALAIEPTAETKIKDVNQQIQRIDSLHHFRLTTYTKLKEMANKAIQSSSEQENDLKKVKKVYAKNYTTCMEYLSQAINPKLDELSYIEQLSSTPEALNVWSEGDELSLIALSELKVKLLEMSTFQNAVAFALSVNKKPQLRVLNSSLNPQVIVTDMINFK